MKNLRQVKEIALTRLKTNLKMKLSVLFLVIVLFQTHANNSYAQKTKIFLDLKNVPIEVVLNEIQKQSEFRFLVNVSEIDLSEKVTVFAKKETIKKVLTKIFKNREIDFEVSRKQIILTAKEIIKQKDAINIGFQQTIQGIVKDADDVPLPGVNILVQGTKRGTQTDFNGKFQIVATEGDVLIFSYLGMKTQNLTIGNNSTVNMEMEEDLAGLDEVIVVGYGNQKRETLAGAVDQVSGVVLESRPITNSLNGLQGVLPGLTITKGSGQPGNEGYVINIRGVSSVNGSNSPLVLIDGVEGDLSLINPADIKSVSILKDAAASIYGARAAYGVVLVTTQTGKKSQKLKVKYATNLSINSLSNQIERLTAREWMEMDWEAKINAQATPQLQDASIGNNTLADVLAKVDANMGPEYAYGSTNVIFNYRSTDWNKIVFDGTGYQQSQNLTFTGGGENSKYNASFGYVDTNGVFKDTYDDSRRFNLRLNYGFDPFEKLRLNTSISYTNQKDESPAISAATILSWYNRHFVWLPERTVDGQYLTQWGFINPRAFLDKDVGKTTDVIEEFRANFTGEYQILDGLYLHGQAAINRVTGNVKSFTDLIPRIRYDGVTSEGPFQTYSNSYRESSESDYLNLTAYIKYGKTLLDKHDLNLTLGTSHEEKEFGNFWANARDLTQNEVTTLGFGNPSLAQLGEDRQDWAIKSYFGRANYTYDSKYIAEVNFRRDGTSIFSPDVRWGNFTGAALAWRASEESFVENLNIFDNLKIRASKGIAGNQNLNPDNSPNYYDYIARVDVFNFNYPFGNGSVQTQAASEAGIVSPLRTWEDIETTNIGIDFAIMDTRLSGRFDLFKKKNKNMQLPVVLPAVLGGTAPSLNIGTLKTDGFELSLTWADRTVGGLNYSVTGILSDATDKLTNLDGDDLKVLGRNFATEGYALNTYLGYVYDGVLETQAEVDAYKTLGGNVRSDLNIGDAKYRDLNGDGEISILDGDGNLADVIDYGSLAPRYSYALTGALDYKGFDFSFFLQGVAKRTLFYSDEFRLPFEQPWWQPLKRFYNNTWSPERLDAKYPRLTTGPQRYWNFAPSQNTKINGAYLRLKNVSVGYSLPGKVVERLNLSKIRIYLSGEDLFTLDHVDGGYDAENTNGNANSYPFTKRYSLGLAVNF
ncbi:TonB-dependent receptor [Arenibacter sp. ARW7G5Y1]|uniref:TonB-dependent receptor n=1 Tax=Arenibacter sp. ARW7G5Y1 TaxID=2135619 RepID=UPI000D774227|nr:TonB-dependent receptor [Arenibacter sp. ARW7G5Y1]PXX22861.1 TonB-linked SusC/RagA family outer membrane protein [Arenibacter sp. ARW7G5Y1]